MIKKKRINNISKDNEVDLFKLKQFLAREYPEVLDDFESQNKQENLIYT